MAEYEASLGNLIIGLITNKKRFDQLEYTTEPIKKQAEINRMNIPVLNQLKEFVIEKTEVVREDNLFIGIEGITDEEGVFLQTKYG